MAQDIKIKYIRLKATKCDKERAASIEMYFFFFLDVSPQNVVNKGRELKHSSANSIKDK